MKLQIQSIHFDADQTLIDYVQEKCDKLDTFFDNIIDGQVYLRIENDSEGDNKTVEIKINVPNEIFISKEKAKKFEEATDFCTDHLRRQLKKHKEKLRAH